jgi:hypothetical protein
MTAWPDRARRNIQPHRHRQAQMTSGHPSRYGTRRYGDVEPDSSPADLLGKSQFGSEVLIPSGYGPAPPCDVVGISRVG